jgi:HAD superfamily hydrolase (TIGR01509 family)
MPKPTSIKAVIFDMDGVLIEAKEWHYEALNRALRHFGFHISRQDHLVTFDGLPTRKKLEMLTKEQGLPTALHPFINDLKQIYTTESIHAHCKPIFQHEFALSSLKSQGYKLGVASNSIRSTIDLMMKKSDLAQYLDIIVSNQDVQNAKPNPEIYLKSMQLLGVQPHETLVLEDNEHGIASARAAGTHLMIVKDVMDVSLDNILLHIAQAEGRSL